MNLRPAPDRRASPPLATSSRRPALQIEDPHPGHRPVDTLTELPPFVGRQRTADKRAPSAGHQRDVPRAIEPEELGFADAVGWQEGKRTVVRDGGIGMPVVVVDPVDCRNRGTDGQKALRIHRHGEDGVGIRVDQLAGTREAGDSVAAASQQPAPRPGLS